MSNNYCTLFDKNYLFKGLALYNSIERNDFDFKLWILCMDEVTFDIFKKMKLKNVELLRQSDIEDEDLLSIKNTRTPGEFSWTCKSYLLLFILGKKNVSILAYLDADLYFFNYPDSIFKELDNANSIVLTPHHFPDKRKYWERIRGRYNAGVIIMKNDQVAIKCINRWKGDCLNWCFQRYEDGKMGDQLYLNKWKEDFAGVYDSKNIGINVAPWNLSKYVISKENNDILVNKSHLILFHFHAFKIFKDMSFEPASGYTISKEVLEYVYEPYFDEINKIIFNIKEIDNDFDFGFYEKVNFYGKIKNFALKIIQ